VASEKSFGLFVVDI